AGGAHAAGVRDPRMAAARAGQRSAGGIGESAGFVTARWLRAVHLAWCAAATAAEPWTGDPCCGSAPLRQAGAVARSRGGGPVSYSTESIRGSPAVLVRQDGASWPRASRPS